MDPSLYLPAPPGSALSSTDGKPTLPLAHSICLDNDSLRSAIGPGAKNRKYGQKFTSGFMQFLQAEELADVIIVAPDSTEHRLHMLLLAYHSEFFRRAFSSDYREAHERRIVLGFEDAAGVWPTMVEYFYTEEIVLNDDNVLPLLAMSRELMVPKIQEYCADYAQNSLESSNAIQYLNQAVQFNCDSFRESCVALVAEGFPSSFSKPTDCLPTEVMLEVLQHPELSVQTEEQVLIFVLNYVKRHNLDAETIRQLFEHVRLPFLSNERLSQLAQEECIPKDMLLSAMALRLQILDHPEKLGPNMPGNMPRKTYICTVEYGMPGGSEFASVPLEGIWEELVAQLRVRVSGDMVEGDAESILRTHDDSTWFMVSGDGQQPVWIEVEFPPNMRVTELNKFTFSHGMNFASHMFPYGISDSAWFQMKGLTMSVSPGETDPFSSLRTQESCAMQLEYTVQIDNSGQKVPAWRRLRIATSEEQAGGNVRLSIRKLKMFGRVEISLTKEHNGRDLVALWRRRKETRMANPMSRKATSMAQMGRRPSDHQWQH